MQNPYQAPYQQPSAPPGKLPFIAAAVGAWGAAAFWGLTAYLRGSDVSSSMNAVMPLVLVGLYAYRGFAVLQGDRSAATNLLWLHGVGALMAATNAASSAAVGGLFFLLSVAKVFINVFGAATAFWARRS